MKGNIKQAVATWCFMHAGEKWDLEKLCQVAKKLGLLAIDVVKLEDFPVLKKYDLDCACALAHWFIKGMNNPLHWEECLTLLKKTINACGDAGYPNVISFSGFADTRKEGGSKVSLEEGIRNCVKGYKKIVGLAEKRKVNICIEPLNTRDGADMKGHPGYQLDTCELCFEVIKKVGSPNLKLLFDAYHIQIMSGDLVRRIQQYKDYIGFVQIAGVPGRYEPDAKQEINYPVVMQALLEAGYRGYVSHEWIPAGVPLKSLRQAMKIIDV